MSRQSEYRDRMRAAHRCYQCGRKDKRTRAGVFPCAKCKAKKLQQQRTRLGLATHKRPGRPKAK